MKSFKQFITEGGNVKIGEHSAQPIKITAKNRNSVQTDVHEMLHHLNKSFHKEYGSHLFGANDKALHTGSAYGGSTRALMDRNIDHAEFAKHKKESGDLDVKIPHEHMEHILHHMQPGKKFGKYTVLGVKKGAEHHALLRHKNGGVHQVDLKGAHYENDEPSHFDQLSDNSHWDDIKKGIKGVHHKKLINAAGGDKHKYSMLYGIGSRETKDPHWTNNTKEMTHKLFGKRSNEKDLHSFQGVTNLIKKHIPASEHQKIYDKFKSDLKQSKGIDHSKALAHLQQHLHVHDHD
jgi:hypothetical protein